MKKKREFKVGDLVRRRNFIGSIGIVLSGSMISKEFLNTLCVWWFDHENIGLLHSQESLAKTVVHAKD